MPDSYKLELLDPKGKTVLKTFTPETRGVADGISCAVDPYGGCDTAEWQARPDLMEAEGAEIVRCFIEDNKGIHPVFYGSIISGAPETKDDGTASYEANARTLLLASPVPPIRYRNQDTAAIAFDLSGRFKHTALSVKPQDFITSGTVLDSFDTTETDGSLADCLDKLVQATENADYGAGIDPSGFVFFKPNKLVLELPYADSDFTELPTTASNITTATQWLYTERPLEPWGGAYNPLGFSYLSIPDAELHERYGYARPRKLPAFALQEDYNTAYASSNFSNPGGAVKQNSSPAIRNSGTTGTYTLTNDDPLVVGVRLKYRASEDAGKIIFRADCGVLYKVELPNTDGELQTLDIPLVPHEGTFSKWNWFRITAASGGSFELHGFYPLSVNTSVLDAAAPLVVPEQRPSQVSVAGIGSLPAAITLRGAPRGDIPTPCAGLRWSWNIVSGSETVYDLGVSALEADASGKDVRVRGYYRSSGK